MNRRKGLYELRSKAVLMPCFNYNGFEWEMTSIDADDKEIEMFKENGLVCLANGATALNEAALFVPDWAKPRGLLSFFHNPRIEGHIRWSVSETSAERLRNFLVNYSGKNKLEALYIAKYYAEILDSWRKGYQQWDGWPKIKKAILDILKYNMQAQIYDSAHWWLISININNVIDGLSNMTDFWHASLEDTSAEIAKTAASKYTSF